MTGLADDAKLALKFMIVKAANTEAIPGLDAIVDFVYEWHLQSVLKMMSMIPDENVSVDMLAQIANLSYYTGVEDQKAGAVDAVIYDDGKQLFESNKA